ncbi:flagellar assembly protein FliX [Polycladidibacter stylochi]|uniref:flagellar assembly protein FliX n=1 Tax=Polycladidibacter stylochi TaxID=1807766 RepID=UPI000835E40C|nr:flagellar assembly protein FliX [Pseudovibrio stylochi]
MIIQKTGKAVNAVGPSAKKKGLRPASQFEPVYDSVQSEGAAASSSSVASLAGVDGLLSLQNFEDSGERKRRAILHGRSLLDMLDALKVDLITGQVNPSNLNKLTGRLKLRISSGQSQLDGLIADIETRAKVELAKLGYFE